MYTYTRLIDLIYVIRRDTSRLPPARDSDSSGRNISPVLLYCMRYINSSKWDNASHRAYHHALVEPGSNDITQLLNLEALRYIPLCRFHCFPGSGFC